MKLYILIYNNGGDDDAFCGAFSTREKAQQAIEKYMQHQWASFIILEETLDEP